MIRPSQFRESNASEISITRKEDDLMTPKETLDMIMKEPIGGTEAQVKDATITLKLITDLIKSGSDNADIVVEVNASLKQRKRKNAMPMGGWEAMIEMLRGNTKPEDFIAEYGDKVLAVAKEAQEVEEFDTELFEANLLLYAAMAGKSELTKAEVKKMMTGSPVFTPQEIAKMYAAWPKLRLDMLHIPDGK